MVKLLEWQGKEIFRRYNIPLPKGGVARSVGDVSRLLGGTVPLPAVIKAQVRVGGRGKGGALRFANTVAEAEAAVSDLIGKEFKGEKVQEVLVEEKMPLAGELYVSITLDRSRRKPILMYSREGGVEIENVADEQIGKIWIHPSVGVLEYEKRLVANRMKLPAPAAKELGGLIEALWRIFRSEDAELVEINPLGIVGDHLVALDSKIILEDDALFRHPAYQHEGGEMTPLEQKAHEKGIAFVEMGGDIGVIANGAGLTMATLDIILENGGRPGVFLDLGGTDDPAKVSEAFAMMGEAKPKVVFINVFGGVTRCDTVATGLVNEMKRNPPAFPLVTRIRGHNEKEGMAILRDAGTQSYSDIAEAVRHVVQLEGRP